MTGLTFREHCERVLGDKIGCRDQNCLYGRPIGQVTNGGCTCWKGGQIELKSRLRDIGSVARLLAREVNMGVVMATIDHIDAATRALGEPTTTDYCKQCGESPDSATHWIADGHDYVDPRGKQQ